MAAGSRRPQSLLATLWFWLKTMVELPFLLLFFAGEILASPLATRRDQSTGWWLVFMLVRSVVPAIIIGVAVAYIVGRLHSASP